MARDLTGYLANLVGPVNFLINGTAATVPKRLSINLVGTGLSVTDNPDFNRTDITFDDTADGIAGDVTGTLSATVVGKLQGRVVTSTAPTNGQTLVWSTVDSQWQPGTIIGFTAGGDLTGSSTSQVVAKINGITITGTPAAGATLRATSSSAASWGQLDLADSDAITGTLPGTFLQAASGSNAGSMSASDYTKLAGVTSGAAVASVSGTAPIVSSGGATPAISINAADASNAGSMSAVNFTKLGLYPAVSGLTTGQIVRATGAATMAFGALDLANTSAVTGTLLGANVQASSGSNAGSMSYSDYTKLAGLPSTAPATSLNLVAGAGLTGGGDLSADRTFNVVAHADGSLVANANDLQVGVLATDAQHGTRGGGTVHANAVASGAAGFMTGTDKAKVDLYPAISGLTTGQVPRATGAATVAFGALDLANTSAVTGTLLGANVQASSGSNAGSMSAADFTKLAGITSGSTDGKWTTILNLDLTAQATQSLSADTNYTIGGLVWPKINSTNDNVAMSLTNGVGIVMQPKSTSNYSTGASKTLPMICLPLTQLFADPSEAMACRIWARISASNDAVVADELIMALDDGTSGWSIYVERGRPSGSNRYKVTGLNNAGSSIASASSTTTPTDVMCLELPVNFGRCITAQLYHGTYSAGFPAFSTLTALGNIVSSSVNEFRNPCSLVLRFGAMRFNSATALSITLSHLLIQYKY